MAPLPSTPRETCSAWCVEPGFRPLDRRELRYRFGATAIRADPYACREFGLGAGLAPRACDRVWRGPCRCRQFSSATRCTAGLATLVSVCKPSRGSNSASGLVWIQSRQVRITMLLMDQGVICFQFFAFSIAPHVSVQGPKISTGVRSMMRLVLSALVGTDAHRRRVARS
jgi:hypothetical protein